MKMSIRIIPVILLALFSQFTATAQLGWRWVLGSVPELNAGGDIFGTVIDDSEYVIVSGNANSSSGYIVIGTDTVYNPGHIDQEIVMKLDSLGHIIWAKGSKDADTWPLDLATDHDGNIYSFGVYSRNDSCTFGSVTLLNPALSNMYYLVKYSPAGNVIWARNVLGNTRVSYTGAIGIDSLNRIYVTGAFDAPSVSLGSITLTNASPTGDTFDVFLAEYDVLGNVVNSTSFGGRRDDYTYAMVVTPTGTIYLNGGYASDTIVIGTTILSNIPPGTHPIRADFFAKFNGLGSVIWAKKLDHNLFPNAITCDNTERLYMTGGFDSTVMLGADTLVSSSPEDLFVAKFDSSGSAIWGRTAAGAGGSYGLSISADRCSNVWVSGAPGGSYMSIYFSGHPYIVPYGLDPSFVARYSTSGVFDTAFLYPSGADDKMFVVPDNKGAVYVSGDYKSAPMIFGADTLTGPPYMYEAWFVAKYKYDSLGCNPEFIPSLSTKEIKGVSNAVSIFPNPANEFVTIICDQGFPSNSLVRITDISGREIADYPIYGTSIDIGIGRLIPGIYQCIISREGNQTEVHKLVVMH